MVRRSMKGKIAASSQTRELSALRLVATEQFYQRVNSALRKADTIEEAAKELQVSHATLKRWILADPGLVGGCDLRRPGRPVKTKQK